MSVTLPRQGISSNLKIIRIDLETKHRVDVSTDPRYIACLVETEKYFDKHPDKNGFLYENPEVDIGVGCLSMIRYIIKISHGSKFSSYRMVGAIDIDQNYEYLIDVEHL